MKNRIVGLLLVLALFVVAGCNSGGRLFFNDPYSTPAAYSTPVYVSPAAAPCGG